MAVEEDWERAERALGAYLDSPLSRPIVTVETVQIANIRAEHEFRRLVIEQLKRFIP